MTNRPRWQLTRAGRLTTKAAAADLREIGDRHGEGAALDRLGIALAGGQRYEEAITTWQETAAIFRETQDWDREDAALDNIQKAQTVQQA